MPMIELTEYQLEAGAAWIANFLWTWFVIWRMWVFVKPGLIRNKGE